MFKIKLLFICAVIVSMITFCFAQEAITITTYYPSPFGSYNQLQASSFGVGDNDNDNDIDSDDVPTTVGDVWIAGNVGIGTNAPSSTLDVRGVIRNSADIGETTRTVFAVNTQDEGNPTADGFRIRFENNFFGGNQDALVIQKTDGDDSPPDGGIAFVNMGNTGAATTAMAIRGDGNVGIGITSPLSRLYIEGGAANWDAVTPGTGVGSLHFDPGVVTNNFGSAITWGASDSGDGQTGQAGIYVRSDGTYGTRMYFATTDAYASGSQTRMMINNDGNVGIGKTSDITHALDIDAQANPEILRLQSRNPGGIIRGMNIQRTNAVGARWRFNSGDGFEFQEDSVTNIMFGENGRVGIGTTSPAERFDVNGSTRIQGIARFYGGAGDNASAVTVTNTCGAGAGCLGVGIESPNVRLDVSGNIEYTGSITDVSDIKTKKNIVRIDNALKKISNIRGFSYISKLDNDNKRKIGFIAQEVEKVLPDVVSMVDKEKGYKGVDYTQIVPVLVEAMKELKSENDTLKQKINALEVKIK